MLICIPLLIMTRDTTPRTIHEVRGVYIRISAEARKKGDGFIEFTSKDAEKFVGQLSPGLAWLRHTILELSRH